MLVALVLHAEDVTVQSHVVDAKTGEALPYVAVYATEDNGTLTNYEGDFSITVDEAVVLKLTCVGYESVSVKASEVPAQIKMAQLEHSMREIEVRAWPSTLLQVAKKLNKEFNSKNGKKSQYFMRMTTTMRSRDLVEAFVEANSAVNLRDITIIQGINGRLTEKGLSAPAVASMNFHHPLELGPLTRNVDFWKNLITPLNKNLGVMGFDLNALFELHKKGLGLSNPANREPQLGDIEYFYDVTGEELVDENQTLIYRLHIKRNDKLASKQPIMTGTLYVDAKTMRPLRFDGQVENLTIQARRDMQIVTAPIELSLHINYRDNKKFTEVSDIAIKMKSGELQNQTLLYNVDDLQLKLKANKKNKAKENMLESIHEAGFDKSLWARSNIIQRTKEEERLAGLENQSELVSDSISQPTTKMGKLIDRLSKFSSSIPQEKVYLHMDNTSYFLGDTIWFAAYTRQTCDDKPSKISHVLYVELYNQDGYMMERKLVEMRDGRGNGSFTLNKDYYGGFYELRAYTRWQLNWGLKVHPHSKLSTQWFLNKEQEMLHYRDYEKLYSRVFPVYDAPKKEGEYAENMTARPMRRYFKKDPDKPTLEMTLYPEGGELVEGLPCRVAYEVLWEDGEEAGDGILNLGDDEGKEEAKAAKQQAKDRKKTAKKELKTAKKTTTKTQTSNVASAAALPTDTLKWQKYRGTFVITPTKGMDRTIRFVDRNGHEAKAKLPKPEPEGVALKVEQTDTTWVFDLAFTPGMELDSLGLTVMHEGNVLKVITLDSLASNLALSDSLSIPGNKKADTIIIPKKELKEGVNQVTIFDVDGRIWADRLFYNTLPNLSHPSLLEEESEERLDRPSVSIAFLGTHEDDEEAVNTSTRGVEEQTFAPYQPIRLGVKSTPEATISLSVRDAAFNDHLYDNATMRTEMLLASEVRGFIPNPSWYFEKDDKEHRDALDLLLMIQGWRRFDWREMAVPGQWEISQAAESTPTISGHVYPTSSWEYHDFIPEDYALMSHLTGVYNVNNPTTLAYANLSATDDVGPDKDIYKEFNNLYDMSKTSSALALDNMSSTLTADNLETGAAPINDDIVYNEDVVESDRQSDEKASNKKKKKNILVHAELVSTDGTESRVTEKSTQNGRFRFLLPGYYGEAILFLSAADTTTWWSKDQKKKKTKDYPWVQMKNSEEDLPEGHKRRFRVDPADWKVIVDNPYPRFVKPYNYYQQHLLEAADKLLGAELLADGTHQMREVKIGAKHGGIKKFSDSIPAIIVDAYQAYNDVIDGGFYYPSTEMIVRNYVGDYGMESPYISLTDPETGTTFHSTQIWERFGYDLTRRSLNNLTTDADSVYIHGNLASFCPYDKFGRMIRNMTPTQIAKYHEQSRIDKYIIYTDYQPRLEGSNRYYGSNMPETYIAIYPYPDDGRRAIYRDRRYVLKGYAYHEDFYHPNYKNRKLDEKPKDYRRTLYWNPALKLDKEGQAQIKLYNNGKRGQIDVSAEGMAKDGTILGN